MSRKAMTNSQFSALKPKPHGQYTVGNLGVAGLSASISHGGSKVFYFRYSAPVTGKRSRIRIGAYPEWSLADARQEARKLRVEVDRGNDPRKDKLEEKRRSQSRLINTVEDLWDDFSEKAVREMKSSGFYESLWRNHVGPHFRGYDIEDFTRSAILDFLDDYREAKSAPIANRCQGLITRLASHAVERRIFEHTPAHNLGKKPKEESRKRYLSRHEVKDFWITLSSVEQLSEAGVTPLMANVLKVCLLTACRRVEVVCANVDEFDFDTMIWSVPANRTKNGREHFVPMSELCAELVRRSMFISDSVSEDRSGWVFYSKRRKSHFRRDSVTTACKRISRFLGGEVFTPHDLRRTATSLMSSEAIGVDSVTMRRILNHSTVDGLGGSFGVYNRHSYTSEKRKALNAWSDYVLSLVG